MKILLLGATGPTGLLTTAAALRAGHEVTVLVRNPSKAAIDGVTVITGDATVDADVRGALAGQHALVSTLGSGSALKSDIASSAEAIFVPAAESLGVKRVVVLSAFGVGTTLKQGSFVQKLAYGSAMKNIFADKAVADAAIRRSSLDYTLVYPVTLDDGPATSDYRAAESIPMKGMPKISRADVADFIVRSLGSSEWVRKTAVIV